MRNYAVGLAVGLFLVSSSIAWAEAIPSFQTSPPEEVTRFIDQAVKQKKASKGLFSELEKALKSDSTPIPVKERAAWALGQLEARNTGPTLVEAAHHRGLLVRAAALNALLHLRARSARAVFEKIALEDPVLALRQRATMALGLLRWEKTIDALVKLSLDQTAEVRGAAALAMAMTHSKKNDFTQALKEMETDPNPYVKERAQVALTLIQKKSKAVQALLSSSDPDIRLASAVYFHHDGKKADLPALQAAISAENDEEAVYEMKAAVQAIKKRAAQAAEKKKAKTS